MNDTYGIDPAAPSDFRDFAHLMRVFDTGQGRFIADFPMEWFHDVRAHMKSLTDLQQMQALELWLKVGRNAVVPTDARFTPARSWPENAAALVGKVKKLIGAKGCPATVQPLDQALLDPNGFPDARGGHILRTAAAYADAARPLLQTSPKVVLIDPYFVLRFFHQKTNQYLRSKRHWKSLSSLLKEAKRWNRVETFRLLVSADKALVDDAKGEVFSADLFELLEEVGAVGKIEIEWDLLDSSVSTERHPRYLLGMSSGLHFDWGFDTDDQKTTNHVEWMGASVLEPLLKSFT